MKKNEELKDKTRNNNFAAAFDYLKRSRGIKTQKELAKRMGVSKDTITRILKAYTPVTEDAITKLQTATDCVFNLQFLRGESNIMLAVDSNKKTDSTAENPHQSAQVQLPDYSSLMNATIAAQDATIASLKREIVKTEESAKREIQKTEEAAKREIEAKEETIEVLRGQLKDKDATIASKNAELAEKDTRLEEKQEMIVNLQQQVSDLRAAIASQQTKDAVGNYPFTIGAAEEGEHPQPKK